MKPLSLSPAEVKEALQTGEVTIERVMEPQPEGNWISRLSKLGLQEYCRWKSPFGSTGQEFFGQEVWGTGTRPDPFLGCVDGVEYEVDESFLIDNIEDLPLYRVEFPDIFSCDEIIGWQPADTMPQWASRLTLIHKETKVEQRDGVWVWVGRMEVKG